MIVTKLKRLLTEDRLHHNRDQLKHIFSLLARQVARSEDTRYNHGIIKPQCSSTGTGTGTAAQAQLTTGTLRAYDRHGKWDASSFPMHACISARVVGGGFSKPNIGLFVCSK